MLDLGRVDNESANSEVSLSFRNSKNSFFKITCKGLLTLAHNQLKIENFSRNIFSITFFKILGPFL